MTYLAVTALINSIFSSAFGLTLLTAEKDKGSKVAINAFSAMCFAVAWWSGAYYFWQIAPDSTSALFFIRLSDVGSIFIAVFFLHFAIYLGKPIKRAKYILYACYLFSITLALVAFSNIYISGLKQVWFFEYWPIPGPVYLIRLIVWLLLVIYAVTLLLKMLPHQKGDQKISIAMISTGAIIGFIGGSTNYLPWYGVNWLPWGNGFVIAYVGFIGYAILRYQALNIKTTAIRLIAFLITVTALIGLFAARSIEDFIIRLALTITIVILSQITISKAESEAKQKEHQHQKLVSQHAELRKVHLANMEYISDIAHRLKTPLAIIQTQSSSDQPATTDNLHKINEVAKTTVATLRNIVQTGKIDADLVQLNRKLVDLQDWLTHQHLELAAIAPDHTVLIEATKPTVVLIDQLILREALYNLVDNARKFSPAGSTICITITTTDKHHVLSVINQGSGISPKDLPRIFDRHFQAKGTRQQFAGSAGLGLGLVKWVAEAHGGHVTITSIPNSATTFALHLPISSTTSPSEVKKSIKYLANET